MKKGVVFLSGLVVVTIVLLTALALAMLENNERRREQQVEAVGYGALALLKVYDEAEKALFFLDAAGVYAGEKAVGVLAENGGYDKKNECKRTDEGVVIWTSCSFFDPKKSFEKEMNAQLKQYLAVYESRYKVFEESMALRNTRKNLGLLPGEVGDSLKEKYTSLVRDAEVETVKEEGSEVVVILKQVAFPVEYAARGSVYKVTPVMKVKGPDFKEYDLLYNALAGCLPPHQLSFEECPSLLSNKFPGIVVKKEGDLVHVQLGRVRLALDHSLALPPREVFQSV